MTVSTYLKENQQKAEFPAVTVCDLNRVTCNNLYRARVEVANESMWKEMGVGTEAEAARLAKELEDVMHLSYCRDTLCNYAYMSTFLTATYIGYIFDFAYHLQCWKLWHDREAVGTVVPNVNVD